MEEWRTNAESGPKDGARLKMTNRLYSSLDERRAWMKDGAQVIPNFIPKRRFRLFLDRARHRPHPDLTLPGAQARRAKVRTIGYGVPSDFELNFGRYLPALGRADDDDTDTRPD
jgi:hypothetical protein